MGRAEWIACVCACACVLADNAASAQSHPGDDAQRRRGTHFILDLTAGLVPGAEPGFAGALTFGGGGRPRGTPIRLYALAELSFARRLPALALHAQSVERDERRYFGLAGGLRLYVPVGARFRPHFDLLAGASYNRAELATAASVVEDSEFYVQGALAAGLQVRVLHAFSFGARVKWLLSDDPLWELREALGLSNAFPFVVAGSLLWHF